MDMMINHIFVYGTLRFGMSNYALVKPYVYKICSGQMSGTLYDLPHGYPAAALGNKASSNLIKGDLLELKPFSVPEALRLLDQLEGYRGEDLSKNLYNRVTQTIQRKGGSKVIAYMYIWGAPEELPELGALVPQGDWVQYRKEKGVSYYV